ncbi:MAG: hypothetical protein QM488_04635 [Rhizobiaceae bacterium]
MELTSLQALGQFVHDHAVQNNAEIIIAHSVASIIASMAATCPQNIVTTVFSLEGNLTDADAYFSGNAAEYDDPYEFKTAFLKKLAKLTGGDPVITRYYSIVETADAQALWQLGCDAKAFSKRRPPGELLMKVAKKRYFFNPANCPIETLDWLKRHPLPRTQLEGASHCPTIDQPALTANAVISAFNFKATPAVKARAP